MGVAPKWPRTASKAFTHLQKQSITCCWVLALRTAFMTAFPTVFVRNKEWKDGKKHEEHELPCALYELKSLCSSAVPWSKRKYMLQHQKFKWWLLMGKDLSIWLGKLSSLFSGFIQKLAVLAVHLSASSEHHKTDHISLYVLVTSCTEHNNDAWALRMLANKTFHCFWVRFHILMWLLGSL